MTTFIEGRELKVNLISASNLPAVRRPGKMKVYAEISLNGEPQSTKKTEADKKGGTHPTWNFTARYTLTEVVMQHPGLNLVVKLFCERTLKAHIKIGEVRIPVKNLFDAPKESQNKILTCEVRDTPEGELKGSYCFGPKMAFNPDVSGCGRRPRNSDWAKDVVTIMKLGLTTIALANELFNAFDARDNDDYDHHHKGFGVVDAFNDQEYEDDDYDEEE